MHLSILTKNMVSYQRYLKWLRNFIISVIHRDILTTGICENGTETFCSINRAMKYKCFFEGGNKCDLFCKK